jgi:hypothetical protein
LFRRLRPPVKLTQESELTGMMIHPVLVSALPVQTETFGDASCIPYSDKLKKDIVNELTVALASRPLGAVYAVPPDMTRAAAMKEANLLNILMFVVESWLVE